MRAFDVLAIRPAARVFWARDSAECLCLFDAPLPFADYDKTSIVKQPERAVEAPVEGAQKTIWRAGRAL